MPHGSVAKIALLPPRRHGRRLADDVLVGVEAVPGIEGHVAGAILPED